MADALTLTWPAVWARRLLRHGLAAPTPAAAPADVADAMCGAHAQVLSAAELSIGLRIDGISRAAVQGAVWEDRTLVKTFGPRGTVHLLPARDLPWWTGALSALPAGPSPGPDVRLAPGQADEVVAAIGDALADAELTVDELTEAIVARTGPWAGERVLPAFQDRWPRWRQVTHLAAHRGALCFGPNRGRKVTFTSPQRWLPGFQPREGAAALAELVRRYLHAYGPATPDHVARWLAAPKAWTTSLFESMVDELAPVDVAGVRAWVVAGDTAMPDTPPRGVRLLPYFDAYQVGCHPRDRLFPGRASARALARGQAGNYPVLLVDGIVAGVWHHRRAGRRLDVTVEPFGRLTTRQRHELDARVARVGEFLGAEPRLTVGTVTVGPHA